MSTNVLLLESIRLLFLIYHSYTRRELRYFDQYAEFSDESTLVVEISPCSQSQL